MAAAESVALAGKMWLYEDDTRTYLGTGKFPGWRDRVDTLEETNRELVRNTAQCALRNFGTWWMDLGATGWFNDPRMWAEMARLKALDEPLLKNPRPFTPEVAAVIDEPSMLRVAAGGDVVTRSAVYEVRRPLGRMGAPYGQYLLDDVTAGRAFGLREAFGVNRPIEPLFAAADASAEQTLAVYPDGSAAVAMKRTGDGLSLFVGPPGLTSELLRAAARQAEVHLFTETDCNVYANGPYMALHASQDGPVDVDTGQPGVVIDLLSGERLGRGPAVTLPMKRGDTRVLAVINRE